MTWASLEVACIPDHSGPPDWQPTQSTRTLPPSCFHCGPKEENQNLRLGFLPIWSACSITGYQPIKYSKAEKLLSHWLQILAGFPADRLCKRLFQEPYGLQLTQTNQGKEDSYLHAAVLALLMSSCWSFLENCSVSNKMKPSYQLQLFKPCYTSRENTIY